MQVRPINKVQEENKDQDSQQRRLTPQLDYFADTWNVLRFTKGTNCQGVLISPDGLTLSITQAQKSSEKIESELCLTNMAFTHGVHYWEINAQISCQFVLIGVYNPVQKTEHLMSFTPKTPRAIFVCLDLFEGTVKFWLNEKRKNRSLKLPMGGPWIPCVKIGHERNVISLNPFAVPPTELTQSQIDRSSAIETLLMPLLQNTLCVTNLPQIPDSSKDEAEKELRKLFKHSYANIVNVDSPPLGTPNMFVFIRFHHYTFMVEFLEKHRSPDVEFKIHEAHDILEWFKSQATASSEVRLYLHVIKQSLKLPSGTLQGCVSLIKTSIERSKSQTVLKQQPSLKDQKVKVDYHPYTDKLIVSNSDANQIKVATRHHHSGRFEVESIIFAEEPQSIHDTVPICVDQEKLKFVLQRLPYQSLLLQEGNTTKYLGALSQFFKAIAVPVSTFLKSLIFQVPLFSAKITIDAILMQIKKHRSLCKIHSQVQNQPSLSELPTHSFQDTDLQVIEEFFLDIHEQLYARTRSDQCVSQVKHMIQATSMPLSPLNSLAQSLRVTNLPARSLDYLLPKKIVFQEVITSQNSPFIVLGNLTQGSITITSSLLQATPLRQVQFFSQDIEMKEGKYIEIYQKFESRNRQSLKFQTSVAAKQVVQTWFTELSSLDQQQTKQKGKTKKGAKKQSGSKPAKKKAKEVNDSILSHSTSQLDISKHSSTQELTEQKSAEAEAKPTEPVQVLFNDAQASVTKSVKTKKDFSQVKISGFMLLSKSELALDPLVVGCVYQYKHKHFIKLRKIMYQMCYLTHFVNDNVQSGNQQNLISSYQQLHSELTSKDLSTVLQHGDCLLDMHPIFVRNQVLKKQYPKWESRLSLLSDVTECEVEIDDCSVIIDFSRVNYSVRVSNQVFVLCRNKDNQVLLKHFQVDNMDQKPPAIKISLKQVAEVLVDFGAVRVFSVEDRVVVCAPNTITVYGLDLQLIHRIDLPNEIIATDSSIANETAENNRFNFQNQRRCIDFTAQNWTIVSKLRDGGQIISHPVFNDETQQEAVVIAESTRSDLQFINEQDFISLSSLFKAEKSNKVRVQKTSEGIYLSESPLNENTHLTFQVLSTTDQVELELSTCEAVANFEVELKFKEANDVQTASQRATKAPIRVFQEPKQLPLSFVSNVGLQTQKLLEPTIILQPDSSVFCSKLSQPEFIFKTEKPIVLTSVEIWSKFSKESIGGFPIGQGMVFAAENLRDLQNTKRMSKSEFIKWAKSRTPDTPLAPHEPILYFDMKGDQKVEVPCQVRFVQFFKFVPTEFRAEPINYKDVKRFEKYSSEVQFFGVKGVLIEDPTCVEMKSGKSDAQNPVIEVNQIGKGSVLAENDYAQQIVQSSEKSQTVSIQVNSALPGSFRIKIASRRLDQVNITTNTCKEVPLSFPRLRSGDFRAILMTSECEQFVEPVVEIIHSSANEQKRFHALQCLRQILLTSPSKVKDNLLQILRDRLQVKLILNKNFTNALDNYQRLIIDLLSQCGVLQLQLNDVESFVEQNIAQLHLNSALNETLEPHTLKNVLCLIQTQRLMHHTTETLLSLLTKSLNKEATRQEGYFILRSQMKVNAYPFDVPTLQGQILDQRVLAADFQYIKINTSYFMKVHLKNTSKVSDIRLIFKQDSKSVHRLKVTIAIKGRVVHCQVFPESTFDFVADKSHKPAIVEHFANVNQDTNEFLFKMPTDDSLSAFDRFMQQSCIEAPQVLNQITIPLDVVGQSFEVQVELLDTYKSVYKQLPTSQVVITPEILGYEIKSDSEEERNIPDSQGLSSCGVAKISGRLYTVYSVQTPKIPNNFLFVAKQERSNQKEKSTENDLEPKVQIEEAKDFSAHLKKLSQQLAEKQKTLASHLSEHKGLHSESKLLSRYVTAINKIKLEIRELVSQHLATNQKLSFEDGCCTLQYTHAITKIVVQFLHKQFLRDASLVKNPHKLYKEVLRCMVLADCGHEAELSPILKDLFEKATPKEQVPKQIVALIDEFIFQPKDKINIQSAVNFLLSDQLPQISLEQLLRELLSLFEESATCLWPKVEEQSVANKILTFTSIKGEKSFTQSETLILSALTFIKCLIEKRQRACIDDPKCAFQLLVRMIADHIMNCDRLYSGSESLKAQAFVSLSVQVLTQVLELFEEVTFNIEEYEGDMLVLLLTCAQSGQEEVKNRLSNAFKRLDQEQVAKLYKLTMGWLQNREHVLKSRVYRIAERESKGRGFAKLFSHYSGLFKMFVTSQTTSAANLKVAQEQLNLFIQGVFVQLDQNVEPRKLIPVLIEIYQNLPYLNDEALSQKVIRSISSQLLSFNSCDQDSLIQQVFGNLKHSLRNKVGVPIALKLMRQFLLGEEFGDDLRYRVCVGMINLFATGEHETQIPKKGKDSESEQRKKTLAVTFESAELQSLIADIAEYLSSNLSFLKTPSPLIFQRETAQNVKLANRLLQLVLYNKDGISLQTLQIGAVTKLIEFLIHSQCDDKTSNSILSKSINRLFEKVALLLEKIGVSNPDLCLAELIQVVEKYDQDLLTQVKSETINDYQAIQIQENLNIHFETLLSAWLVSEEIVSNFLGKMKGFDFMISRLRGKPASQVLSSLPGPIITKIGSDQVTSTLSDIANQNNSRKGPLNQSSDEIQSEDEDSQVLEFLQQQTGLKLLKKTKQVNQKVDHVQDEETMMTAARQKTILKKQTALFPTSTPSNYYQAPSSLFGFAPNMAIPPQAMQTMPNKSSKKKLEPKSAQIVQTKGGEDFIELELSKSMRLVDCSEGKTILTKYSGVIWNKFKQQNQSAAVFNLSKPSFSQEYYLTFDLGEVFQLQEAVISFNLYPDTFKQSSTISVIPLCLFIEAYQEEPTSKNSEPLWKQSLQRTQELSNLNGYFVTFGSNMIGYNFQANNDRKNPIRVGKRSARYLKFVFKLQDLMTVDTSMLQKIGGFKPQQEIGKAYQVASISITGAKIMDPATMEQHIQDLQRQNAIKTISNVLNGKFIGALQSLGTNDNFTDKIIESFDFFAQMLATQYSEIKPLFVTLCQQSEKLSDWLIEQKLLINLEANDGFGSAAEGAKQTISLKQRSMLLFDILQSNTSLVPKRLNQVLKNILAKTEMIASQPDSEITSSQEICSIIKVYLTIANAIVTQEKVFPDTSSVIKLAVTEEQTLNLVALAKKVQKMSQKRSIYSLVTILLKTPKPFQSDLNATLVVQAAVAGDVKSGLYFQTLIDGGLSEDVLQNLLDNEINQTSEGIEALRLIWMNVYQLKPIQLFQLYGKLVDLSAAPKALTALQLEFASVCNLAITEIAFHDDKILSDFAARILKDMSELSRTKFNKFVGLPFITTPKTTDVSLLHIVNPDNSIKFLPFYQVQGASTGQKLIDTSLLSEKDLDMFQKHLETLVKQNAGKFIKNAVTDRWERVYATQPTDVIQTSAQFEKFAKSIQNRKLLFVVMQIKSDNEEFSVGYFSAQETNKFEIDYNQDTMCTIMAKKYDFIIFSSAKHSAIMTAKELPNDTNQFMTIYTDYADSAFVQFFLSFQLSFSNQSKSYFFNSLETAVTIQNQFIKDHFATILHKDIELKKIEVWTCGQGQANRPVATKSNLSRGSAKKLPYYKLSDAASLATWSIKFAVPSNLTLKELRNQIGIAENTKFVKPCIQNGVQEFPVIQDIEKVESSVDIFGQLYLKEVQPQVVQKQQAVETISEQVNPGFNAFSELKGARHALINAAVLELQQYQKPSVRELFSSHLSEVQDFSKLTDDYLSHYLDKSRLEDVIHIIEHKPDMEKATDEEVKKIKSQMQTNFCHALNVLNQELKRKPDLVGSFLTLGVFEKLTERIGSISGEFKRKKIIQSEQVVVEPKPEKKRKAKTEAFTPNPAIEKKGVGYTTSVGEVWDVDAYLQQKLESSSIITQIIQILEECVKNGNFDDQGCEKLKTQLLESSLLPTLESAFRSGSLLEMAKEMDLYLSYLQFTLTLAKTSSLFEVLLEIGDTYEPRQKDTIFELVKQAAGLAEIFLSCLNRTNTEGQKEEDLKEAEKPQKLAEKFLEVYNYLKEKVKDKHKQSEQVELQQLLAMPLEDAHRILCKPLRFKYMNMEKGTNKQLDHFFANQAKSNANPPTKKLIRLAQEIADLTNSLPAEHTSAVFCRVAQKKVDYMKCLIMGAEGTPYAHGAFIYDVYFSDQYPEVPPKVQLITTGGGTIRFNPNLYAEGKVCLSLLGTWRGQSTENWDAKVSTVLQVLLSIQAIIMSNEVYFNEPGHEQELGTPNGEKLNRGYSNIVRYGNAKFAILEQLRNPAKGFEDAIKASFFLKKDKILADIQQWIDEETSLGSSESNYGGLVSGHNLELAKNFGSKDENQSYLKKLKEVLEELKEEFKLLQSPYHETVEQTNDKGENEEKTLQRQKSTVDLFEDIDMAYEQAPQLENQEEHKIDINDEKVKDRWSRYIGAMGIEAVAKQAEATVFISGLGATGVEIAKNIILAGCKELILYDTKEPSFFDLSGQFFLTEDEIQEAKLSKKTRAEISKIKLQQLNTYVKVTVLQQNNLKADEIAKELLSRQVRIAVFTDSHKVGLKNEDLVAINQPLRLANIPMILADQSGLFSRIINDFGTHNVTDLTGEEILDVMIQQITVENEIMTVKTIQNHDYQDGDEIKISQAVGLDVDQPQKIEVIDVKQFRVKQPVGVSGVYQHNGIARLVKKSKEIQFSSFKDVLSDFSDKYIDADLRIMDFEKLENQHLGSIAFKLIGSHNELEPFIEETSKLTQNEKCTEFFTSFFKTKEASFGPLAAYLGGIVGQEIVKAITQKFKPITQEIYLDVVELYQEPSTDQQPKNDRSISLITCFGDQFVQRIQKTNLFMVGAGAIGCELLKNFAMLGLGTQGQVTLTDPDVIEVSNLNRQFLFREKHLRKPKSHTAAAAAIQMNPAMKGHISARLDKLHNDTSEVYSEDFFKKQDIVANALDNVAARVYVDSKCLSARTMLVDSGTLGPKGHVQVICPFKTENYASQEDAQDNNEIPHCTLKMFPEETLHCVEWAKDLFGQTFTLQPKCFNKLLETPLHEIEFENQTELKGIEQSIKMAGKTKSTFEDLIREARKKFQKLFHDNILQLVHVYPLDKVTAEGRPFWALPKRPPRPLKFDRTNEVHRQFVAAYACLLAQMRGIAIPGQARSDEFKQWIADEASKVQCKQFVPSDAKAQQIESQVNKQENKEVSPSEQQHEITIDTTYQASSGSILKQAYQNVMIDQKPLTATEFEKDIDSNFHVDFIYASANARAQNYDLAAMDWITVKIKAGKIVPALATTTAAIAALQTIEILKLLKVKDGNLKINATRNTFLNMAGPYMMMSEPGEPVTNKLTAEISVNVWDRWEVTIDKASGSLSDVISDLAKRFAIQARDVLMGAQPLFLYAMRSQDKTILEQDEFKCPLTQLLKEKTDMLAVSEWVDLTLTFVTNSEIEGEKMLENVPTVRVIFK